MDPTVNLIRITNSFKQKIKLINPDKFSSGESEIKLSITEGKNIIENKYIDREIYEEIRNLEQKNKTPEFFNAKKITNPFNNLGKSIFRYNDSVKLANLDAVLNITKHQGGYRSKNTIFPVDPELNRKQFETIMKETGILDFDYDEYLSIIKTKDVDNPRDFSFAYIDINGAPGAFSEYIQWRRPDVHGVGISPVSREMWKQDILDLTMRFFIHDGDDNTGDIKTNIDSITKYTLDVHSKGLDLFISSLFLSQDNLITDIASNTTFHDLTSIIMTAIIVLKEQGTFVLRLYDTYSSLAGEFIYLISLVFKNIWLMKPISSPVYNQEKFLVAKELKTENLEIILDLLAKLKDGYNTGKQIKSIFSEDLPVNFQIWLTNINNVISAIQMDSLKAAEEFVNKKCEDITLNEYNKYKALALWNLPDNNIGF